MVAYEITLTDSIRIKYGNHDSKHPKGSLRIAKEGNSVQFSDLNRQRPNLILDVNFDEGDTLTIDGAAVTNSVETLEALGTDFFSRAASGGEPDPQIAINTASIAQNALIAKMDTLQGGEIIPEAGSVNAYNGRQWVSLADNVEVPDPVSIAILEASDDFEELTIPRSRYRRLFPDAISSDFTNWDNPDSLTLVLIAADGVDATITYGNFQSPRTLTILGDKARLFQFEGTGWFPVVDDVAPIVTGESGLHFIAETPAVNIGGADTAFPTGWDLTRPGRWMIRFIPADNSARDWQSGFLNVDKIVERFNAGDDTDGFVHVFDNDFIRINLVDPVTGEFVAREAGRDVEIRAELWLAAPTALRRIDVFGGSQTLTGSYVNYGDPQDELTLINDGDQIEFIYGDGTSANGLFVDGIANVGREGGIASETRIVDDQLQTRAEEGSTLSNVVRITIFRRALVTSPVDLNQLASDVARLNGFHDDPATGVVSAGATQNAATATTPAIRFANATFTPTPGIEYTLTHAGKNLGGTNNTAIVYLDNEQGERVFDTLNNSLRINAANPTREHTHTFTETDGEITVSFQSGGGSSADSHELAFTIAGETPPPINGLDIGFFGDANGGAVASDFFTDDGNFQMQLRNSTGTIQIYRATIPGVGYSRIPHLEPNLFTLETTRNDDGTYDHTFSGWLPALVAGQAQSGSIRILGGVPIGTGLGLGAQDQLIIQSKSAFGE